MRHLLFICLLLFCVACEENESVDPTIMPLSLIHICMQVYHDKAVEVLMTLPESEAREGLLLLADYIVERRK